MSSTVYTFIYLCPLKPNNVKNYIARMIVYLHESDYVDTNISGTYEWHPLICGSCMNNIPLYIYILLSTGKRMFYEMQLNMFEDRKTMHNLQHFLIKVARYSLYREMIM